MSTKPLTEAQKAKLADYEKRDPAKLSATQKKEFEDLKDRADAVTDALRADDNVNGEADFDTGGDLYVFANLPSAQSFKIGEGAIVTLNGVPVSDLKGPRGTFYPGGKYGVTKVSASAWAEVVRVYGKMKMFSSGLIFAADTFEEGQAKARERGALRHGYEPVDPESRRVKSAPDDKKE